MLPLALLLVAAAPADDPPKAKFVIGKDTTYVDGPIDKDGYIDYEAALNERLAKEVTPDTNALVLIWSAIGPNPESDQKPVAADYFKRLGVPAPPAGGEYFVGFEAYQKARGRQITDGFADGDRELMRRPWAAKDRPDYADWLKRNEKPLAVVGEAVRRPTYYNPLVSRDADDKPGPLIQSRLPTAQPCREIGAALCQQAMLRLADGQFDAAWADILTAKRLARHVARGGALIEVLVGYAIDGRTFDAATAYIAAAKPTSARVRELVRDLDALPPMPAPAEKVDLCERLNFLDAVQLARRGGLDALRDRGPGGKADPDELEKLELLHWEKILRIGNQWYDRVVANAKTPARAARVAGWAKIEADLRQQNAEARKGMQALRAVAAGGDVREAVSESVGRVLVGLLLPAVGKVSAAHDRHVQCDRLTRLALALAAHRADAGRYPDALAGLAPTYIPAVPNDIFIDKPLAYKPTDDGYLLSSVGPDEKEDGGREQGDDIAVRMPPAVK